MRKLLAFTMVIVLSLSMAAQESQSDQVDDKKTEQVKTGWSFGALPAISYDADVGFRYGALANIYNYGDGSRYPMYDHSIYLEWSRTTKGSGNNTFTWDSDRLIPGIRSFIEFSYLTEKALDFYGFNGYEVKYDNMIERSEDASGDALRLFYRHDRKLLRTKADFQGEIIGQKLRWLVGIGYFGNTIGSVDIAKLNEGKDPADLLSSESLYDKYVAWGVIKDDQKNGGGHTMLKGGLVFDTRDNEPNPFSGIWTELQFHYLPSFLSNTDYSYGRLVLTHRQYFTLLPDKMNFAYRLSYQGTIFGEMPFYMMPYMFNTAPQQATNGVGGNKTVRGVMRNRIVGDGIAYGNVELRYKFVQTKFLKQNFYIAASAFMDAGMVVQPFKLPDDMSIPASEEATYFDFNAKEVPHIGYGVGLHFVLNQNFIVAVDYAYAAKATDGVGGNPYIGLNFLF
ncbi:BamA/TamA family outer membrane protein [Bacteroidota bacterium]